MVIAEESSRRGAILDTVGDYYSRKIVAHGATPQGVDWRDSSGQNKRFSQLLRRFDLTQPFTISEVGCGYGALVGYLRTLNVPFTYEGFDISSEMIAQAKTVNGHDPDATFEVGTSFRPADYVVASGIFNVRFDFEEAMWSDHVIETLDRMVGLARRGIAVNFLSGFSDEHRKEARLWYPDPGRWLGICLSRYSRSAALFHDYGLYEFTIAIDKSGYTP